MTVRIQELLQRSLRAGGVDAVYGAPFGTLPVVPVADPSVAVLLAGAHELVHRRAALVHGPDGVIDRPGPFGPRRVGVGAVVEPASAEDLVGLALAVGTRLGAPPFRLGFDPGRPVGEVPVTPPPPPDRFRPARPGLVERIASGPTPVVLAGPGVLLQAGGQGALQSFAVALSAGVLNTWGAKGVFDWRSRHHLATAGLQRHDFELGGLAGAGLVVATGIDPDEAPGARWMLAPTVEVEPSELGPLAEAVRRPFGPIEVPPLRAGLVAVTQAGWVGTWAPLAPTRVTRHYGEVLGIGGLVAADAGLAGYWVARTFSTTELGSAVVPSRPVAGMAAAAAVVARLTRPWRPALAVVDGPIDPATVAVLEVAGRLGVGVGVEAWRPDGPALDPDVHLERLRWLVGVPDRQVAEVGTDPAQLARMVEVAGPVVAWPGHPGRAGFGPGWE